jgi:hypothetical protein
MGATFNSGNPTRPQSRRPEGHIERRSQTERRSQDAPERFRRIRNLFRRPAAPPGETRGGHA